MVPPGRPDTAEVNQPFPTRQPDRAHSLRMCFVSEGRPVVAAAIVCAVLTACTGGSGDGGGHSSKGAGTSTTGAVGALAVTSAGYSVPAHLRRSKPGTLIGVGAAVAQAERLGAGRAWRMLYHSNDLSGRDIAVSGLVLVPTGRASTRMAARGLGTRHHRPRRSVRAVDRGRARARLERGARGARVAGTEAGRCRERLPRARNARRAHLPHQERATRLP